MAKKATRESAAEREALRLARRALKTLVKISEDETVNGQTRVWACTALLDRGFGKPGAAKPLKESTSAWEGEVQGIDAPPRISREEWLKQYGRGDGPVSA